MIVYMGFIPDDETENSNHGFVRSGKVDLAPY